MVATDMVQRGVRLAVRYLLGALGLFVVLYLAFVVTLTTLNQLLAAWLGAAIGPAEWELLVSLGGATVGSLLLAIPFAQGIYSLERLWLFAVTVHLLAYALLAPLLWMVPGVLEGPADGNVPYVILGYALFALAVVAAFVVAYRAGYDGVREWLANV